jgi:hypothetical protein
MLEQDAGLLPVSLDGSVRGTHRRSNFLKRQTTKKFQIDDLRKPRLDIGKRIHSVSEALQFSIRLDSLRHLGGQHGDLEFPAAFLR